MFVDLLPVFKWVEQIMDPAWDYIRSTFLVFSSVQFWSLLY